MVGVEGKLSASFDGLTMDESQGRAQGVECGARAAFDSALHSSTEGIQAGNHFLPIYHRVQMEQQLLVSGAERILFMASEWTADGDLVEERHVWYYRTPPCASRSWKAGPSSIATWPPTCSEAAQAAPVGKTPDTLPALRIG